MIQLLKPSMAFKDEIMEYRQAFLANNDSLDGCGGLENFDTTAAWLAHLALFENEESCPKDRVPSTTFIAVNDDKKLIGIIDFRHHINHPILSVWGGHIGYSVHPLHRKQGHGTQMLVLMLDYISDFGLDKVLITCHDGNIGSEKIIRTNGGIYESNVDVDGESIKRFWIHLQ